MRFYGSRADGVGSSTGDAGAQHRPVRCHSTRGARVKEGRWAGPAPV
jgi:hypothetical protein